MKETFREYYNRKEKELDEAIKVLNKNGYKVLNEGKITKIITGLALVAGLITNAMAKDFNAKAADTYNSKATTAAFDQNLKTAYNLGSDVKMSSEMVQNIADIACKKIYEKMLEENKYDKEDMEALAEWDNAVEFYKSLKKVDKPLADAFSRRLDKALTKSLSIASNIEEYAAKHPTKRKG